MSTADVALRSVALRALGPATAAAALYGGLAATLAATGSRAAALLLATALLALGLTVGASPERWLASPPRRAALGAVAIGLAVGVALLGDGASNLFLGLLMLSGILAATLPVVLLVPAAGALVAAYASLVDPAQPHVALQIGAVALLAVCPVVVRGALLRRSHRPAAAPATLEVPPQPSALTPRQLEALSGAAEGLMQHEIADRLGISVSQVGRLLAQARERTGTATTAAAVAYAKSHDILLPP